MAGGIIGYSISSILMLGVAKSPSADSCRAFSSFNPWWR